MEPRPATALPPPGLPLMPARRVADLVHEVLTDRSTPGCLGWPGWPAWPLSESDATRLVREHGRLLWYQHRELLLEHALDSEPVSVAVLEHAGKLLAVSSDPEHARLLRQLLDEHPQEGLRSAGRELWSGSHRTLARDLAQRDPTYAVELLCAAGDLIAVDDPGWPARAALLGTDPRVSVIPTHMPSGRPYTAPHRDQIPAAVLSRGGARLLAATPEAFLRLATSSPAAAAAALRVCGTELLAGYPREHAKLALSGDEAGEAALDHDPAAIATGNPLLLDAIATLGPASDAAATRALLAANGADALITHPERIAVMHAPLMSREAAAYHLLTLAGPGILERDPALFTELARRAPWGAAQACARQLWQQDRDLLDELLTHPTAVMHTLAAVGDLIWVEDHDRYEQLAMTDESIAAEAAALHGPMLLAGDPGLLGELLLAPADPDWDYDADGDPPGPSDALLRSVGRELIADHPDLLDDVLSYASADAYRTALALLGSDLAAHRPDTLARILVEGPADAVLDGLCALVGSAKAATLRTLRELIPDLELLYEQAGIDPAALDSCGAAVHLFAGRTRCAGLRSIT